MTIANCLYAFVSNISRLIVTVFVSLLVVVGADAANHDFVDGSYYLYNAEANAYVDVGGDWSTQAVVGHGRSFMVSRNDAVDNSYYLCSNIENNNGLYIDQVNDGFYMDRPKAALLFERVAGSMNEYTIRSAAGKYLSIDYLDRSGSITNASYEDNIRTGWDGTELTNATYGCAEFYNKTFDYHQTIRGLRAGRYRVGVQAFYRAGFADGDYATKDNPNNSHVMLYVTSAGKKSSVVLARASSEASSTRLGGNEVVVGGDRLIPNNMEAASKYFAKGMYHNYIEVEVGLDGELTIGLEKTEQIAGDWTIFDNWTLEYYCVCAGNKPTPWIVKSINDRIDDLATATVSKGMDATFLITSPGFDAYDTRRVAWTGLNINNVGGAGGINDVNHNYGITNSAFDIKQTISNIPNGRYVISAQGLRTDGSNDACLYANGVSVQFPLVTGIGNNAEAYTKQFKTGNCKVNVEVIVTNGTLTIGAKGTKRVGSVYIDNFELTYYDNGPAVMDGAWVKVTGASHDAMLHPEKYLFSIWSDNNTCFTLGKGQNGGQGKDYNTMVLSSGINPIDDLSYMWEFYHREYMDNASGIVIGNASDREHLLCIENKNNIPSYYRFKEDTNNSLVHPWTINWQSMSASFMTISNGGSSYYMNSGQKEVTLSTAEKKYMIYAISRVDYLKEKYNIVYTATTLTPKDVSILVANPDGVGTDGTKDIVGWDTKNEDGEKGCFEVSDGTFAQKNGRSYFTYETTSQKPEGDMRQTIAGLPKGYYLLSVTTAGAENGAILYVNNDGSENHVNLSSTDVNNRTFVPFEVKNDGDNVVIGVRYDDYQAKVDEGGNSKWLLSFDNFNLKYLGTPDVLASPIGEGDYYLRTKVGSEYRYLEAGGEKWGTSPILGKHGAAYTFEKNGVGSTGGQYYALRSYIYEYSAGQHFNGYYNDRTKGISKLIFEQATDEMTLDYRILVLPHVLDDSRTNTPQPGGYLYPNGDKLETKDDNDDATIWQVVSELQRIKEMANASTTNHVDATFFIKDPNFNRNDTRSGFWKVGTGAADTLKLNNDSKGGTVTIAGVTFTKGDNNMALKDRYNVMIDVADNASGIGNGKYYEMKQTIVSENFPAGLYVISAQGFSNEDNGAVLFASDGTNDLATAKFDVVRGVASQNDAGNIFATGANTKSFVIEVKEGSRLTIGVRGFVKNCKAFVDNFQMEYMGEKPIDIYDIADGSQYYIYNIDAGAYLTSSDVKSRQLSMVGNSGLSWKMNLMSQENGIRRFKISQNSAKNNNSQIVQGYLAPADDAVSSSVQYVVNGDAANSAIFSFVPYSDGVQDVMYIVDEQGRYLEWSGDGGNLVFAGVENEHEPRGRRWALYTNSQYDKDVYYAANAHESRRKAWPLVRAARVNLLQMQSDNTKADIQGFYNALDGVWVRPQSSSTKIEDAGNELRAALDNALLMRTEADPMDVSYMISNADFGSSNFAESSSAWNGARGNWTTSLDGVNENNGIIQVGQYAISTNASRVEQILSGIPSGKYMLALDIRSNDGSNSKFKLSLANDASPSMNVSYSNDSEPEFVLRTITTPYVMIDEGQKLTIGLELSDGAIAFDNFRLIYCGPHRYNINADKTEMELIGRWNWNDESDIRYFEKLVDEEKNTLGAVYFRNEKTSMTGQLSPAEPTDESGSFNIIYYTDVNQVSGTNVVALSDLSCADFVIADKHPLYIPEEFTASKATYRRTMSATPDKPAWTTICLPFSFAKNVDGNIEGIYRLASFNGEYMKVLPLDDATSIESNEPSLVKVIGSLNIVCDNVLVSQSKASCYRSSPAEDGMCMVGTYSKYLVGAVQPLESYTSDVKNDDGFCAQDCYYTKSGTFVQGEGWFYCTPFRAFFYLGDDTNGVKIRPAVVKIVVEDGFYNTIDTDCFEDNIVEGFYDVNGIQLKAPRKGMNIIKLSDDTVKKVFIRK